MHYTPLAPPVPKPVIECVHSYQYKYSKNGKDFYYCAKCLKEVSKWQNYQ